MAPLAPPLLARFTNQVRRVAALLCALTQLTFLCYVWLLLRDPSWVLTLLMPFELRARANEIRQRFVIVTLYLMYIRIFRPNTKYEENVYVYE